MKSAVKSRRPASAAKAEPSSRRSFSFGASLIAAATIGALLGLLWPKMTVPTGGVSESAAPQETVPADSADHRPSGRESNASSIKRAAPAQEGQLVGQAEPKPEMRELVEALVKLQAENGLLTTEFAKGWKQNLQQLIQEGPAAIPAIQEFLARNLDYVFGDAGRQLLGYSSARVAMFDALTQIGGPEAVAALSGVLQTTADPREIAVLAQELERLEPQQHQADVLNAARQALELAGSHKQETADPAPLFEVFQKYGGANIASELVKSAAQWNYYATIALAQLPDGSGIPSLIQIAKDPKSAGPTREAALQMLAQVSDQSPEARAALVDQARQNGISLFALRMIASVMAGDQVGFINSAFEHPEGLPQVGGLRTTSTSDNQNFFAMPSNLNSEQIGQRAALLNELLAATSEPAAKELLQQLKNSLTGIGVSQ